MTKRNVALISVLFLLLFVKFVLLPVNDAIDASREKVEELQNRKYKGESRLAYKETIEKNTLMLNEKMEVLLNRFKVVEDGSLARIEFQRQLETSAKEYGVKLKSITWNNITEERIGNAEIDLKFEAPFKAIMLLHNRVETFGFNVETKNIFINVSGQNLAAKNLGDANGRIVLQVSYLVRGDEDA